MQELVLTPTETRRYQLTLRQLDRDGYVIEMQEADAYFIHTSGFHTFVTRGRVVRALVNWRVIEVREVSDGS